MQRSRDPWSKFYWADWRSDPKLRACSLGGRGLWVEMLGLMHEATPYGHLLVNGRAPTDQQLAVMVGASLADVRRLKRELEAAGVPTVEDGIWISRRMVRDAHRRAVNQGNGAAGGNPKLKDKGSDNRIGYPKRITDPVKAPDKSHDARDPEARSQKPDGGSKPPSDLSVSARQNGEAWPDIPPDLDRTTPQARAKALHPRALEALGSAPNASPDWLTFTALTAMFEGGASEALILETCKAIGAQAPPGTISSWKYIRSAVDNAQARKSADEQADKAESKRSVERVAAVLARLARKPAEGVGLVPGGDADAVLPAVPGG